MAPRHTQGGALFLVPNKPRTGVLVSLSHPLLTQASTQLYTFSGFGLTPYSHSPPSLPGSHMMLSGPFWGFFLTVERFGAFEGLRWPPGASRGLRGPPGPSRGNPETSAFPSHFQKARSAPVPPQQNCQGFRVANNLVSHSKGERSPRRGSCPTTWKCSSRSTNFLGLHSISKRWCE